LDVHVAAPTPAPRRRSKSVQTLLEDDRLDPRLALEIGFVGDEGWGCFGFMAVDVPVVDITRDSTCDPL
jgi:hypothetical protein